MEIGSYKKEQLDMKNINGSFRRYNMQLLK